jgi:hypothetical protein
MIQAIEAARRTRLAGRAPAPSLATGPAEAADATSPRIARDARDDGLQARGITRRLYTWSARRGCRGSAAASPPFE